MPVRSIAQSAEQYANYWLGKERAFVAGLASPRRQQRLAALVPAAAYFKVARNFGLAFDVERGLDRLGPALDILDRYRPAVPTPDSFQSLVTDLSRELASAYNMSDLLSAATKFLWLMHRHPIVIFDSNVRGALASPLGDYASYVSFWEARYAEHADEIEVSVGRLRPHPHVPATEEWFRRRVFDIYLWNAGG